MKGLDAISSALFEKIRSRFPRIQMGDENGTPTQDESQARFFDFDYIVNGENKGNISISINEVDSLKLYFSQGMIDEADDATEAQWYDFLKDMRFFSKKHMMTFDTKDIAKTNLDKRDFNYLANNKMQESKMYGTTKSSYEELDKTKLIIRHKKEINAEQTGARTRNINSLFIENSEGERYKYPYSHLAGARAMTRHVANGGTPHDDFGKHIIETSSNIAKLTAFKRFVGKKDFMNTTSNDIIEGSNIELENLRTHIKKLQGQQYYKQTTENFTPVTDRDTELGEDVVNELTNAFTIPQFNEDLTDMFPLLHSIHQKRVAETTLDLDDVVKESNDPKVDAFLQKVANAEEEGFDMLYDANSGKYGDAIFKAVGDMYNDVAVDNGYHPDDDFEKIYDRMLDNIEADYGPNEDIDEFESWADSITGEDDNNTDTTDVTIDKDGAMSLPGNDEETKDEKASTEDIIEFVRSFYDKETGAFPKGETGVVISARKRFGDSVGDLVEKFVSKLTGKEVQVENDEEVEEGSIKYMHSLKAKGHSDEEIAKELNMSADEVKKAMNKTNEEEYDKERDKRAERGQTKKFTPSSSSSSEEKNSKEFAKSKEKETAQQAVKKAMSKTVEADEERKPVRYDPKSKMPFIMKWSYQPDVTRALRKAAGLSDDAPVYFDDADLVYGDETVWASCGVDDKCTFGDAVMALKKFAKENPLTTESVELDYIKDKLAKLLR